MKFCRFKNSLLSSISEQCHVIVDDNVVKQYTLEESISSLDSSVVWVCILLSLARLLPEYGDPLVVVVDHALLVLVEVLDEGELEAGRRPFQPLQFYVLSANDMLKRQMCVLMINRMISNKQYDLNYKGFISQIIEYIRYTG